MISSLPGPQPRPRPQLGVKPRFASFRDMPVWQTAMEVAERVFALTDKLPRKEDYGLTSQIRRAALSISANISEAFGRNHTLDKVNIYYSPKSRDGIQTQRHKGTKTRTRMIQRIAPNKWLGGTTEAPSSHWRPWRSWRFNLGIRDIARGSVTETQSHLEYGRRVGYLDAKSAEELSARLSGIYNDINKVITTLRKSSK